MRKLRSRALLFGFGVISLTVLISWHLGQESRALVHMRAGQRQEGPVRREGIIHLLNRLEGSSVPLAEIGMTEAEVESSLIQAEFHLS